MNDVAVVIEVDRLQRLSRSIGIDVQHIAVLTIIVCWPFAIRCVAVPSQHVISKFEPKGVRAIRSCPRIPLCFCIPYALQKRKRLEWLGSRLGAPRIQ